MDNKDTLIESLKKENEYLKKLLDMHNIPYQKEEKEIKQLSLSSTKEKIDLYKSYFRGRDDVFAFKYISKDGKKGYITSCKNRPNITGYCSKNKGCNSCPYKEDLELSDDLLIKHFKGEISLGIYPIIDNDYCYFVAVDFDDKDFKESALTVSHTLHKHNIDNLIEISQSSTGAHVWIFFNEKIKASKARRLLTYLLLEASEDNNNVDFLSIDRLFPSQDLLPTSGGYGNCIALPLDGNKIKEGTALFVDHNFDPYPINEQLNVLASIRKINVEEALYLLDQYKERDSLTFLNKSILNKLKLSKEDFASNIIITIDNDIAIPKAALNNKSLKFLYRLASVANPLFYKYQKLRKAIYQHHISRVQVLYDEDEDFIYLPRGCYEDLIKLLNYLHINIDLIDKRISGSIIPISFKGTLLEKQKEGLEKLKEYDNGLFVAPPAYGKTVAAIALIATLKINTLIIVPNLTLLKQWKERLETFLDVNYDYKKEKFGTYSGNKKKTNNCIDIACIDSLVDNDELYDKYGLTIIDEVHHIGANSYEKVARKIRSKYLYGFTATPKRSDKNEPIVFKTIGNIRYQYKENGINKLIKILNPIFTYFSYNLLEDNLSYSEQINILLKNEDRNNLIVENIIKAYKNKKNILVLTDRIEHIEILKNKLEDVDNLYIINGSLSTSEKKDFFFKLENTTNGFIVLSTGKYIGEGFDEKKLDTLFIVSPFRWSGTLEQYIGRLNRTHENKHEVNVYDFIDIKVNMFNNMFDERLRGYKKNDYQVVSDDNYFNKIIFDNSNYYSLLTDDITSSKSSVIFIVDKYDDLIINELLNLKDGISIKSNNFNFEHPNINSISSTSLSTNMIIIDKRIVWFGSLNPFIKQDYYVNIMRIDNKEVADNIVNNSKIS